MIEVFNVALVVVARSSSRTCPAFETMDQVLPKNKERANNREGGVPARPADRKETRRAGTPAHPLSGEGGEHVVRNSFAISRARRLGPCGAARIAGPTIATHLRHSSIGLDDQGVVISLHTAHDDNVHIHSLPAFHGERTFPL